MGRKSTIHMEYVERWRSAHPLAKSPHWVYFIGCEQYVKIGITGDLKKRFASLSNSNPLDLVLLCAKPYETRAEAYAAELKYHARFAAAHHRAEWFRMRGDIADEVRSVLVSTGHS